MITQFKINGFKGFHELEIPALSMVNLIGGKNNAGKTSFLEALFMFHDRQNPQMILRQFAWRGVGAINFDPSAMWAPIFCDYNMNNNISMVARYDDSEESMVLEYNPAYTPASIPAEVRSPGFRPKQIKTDQRVEPSHSIDITYNVKGKIKKTQKVHLTMGPDNLGIHIEKPVSEARRAVFLGARVNINPSEDAQRFGQLDVLGKQDIVVEFLRIIEPRLTSLSSIATGETSLIHGDIGLSRKIPVSYMGDGVSRLLSIILAIATARDGVVFIDEFENGIHYSVMDKIWDAVTRAAREFNCQVIGTTHSYECLVAAHKGISDELKEDFTYIRIDKINSATTAKCFKYDSLEVAIKTNLEVR